MNQNWAARPLCRLLQQLLHFCGRTLLLRFARLCGGASQLNDARPLCRLLRGLSMASFLASLGVLMQMK
jgi:hypothetical protein